MSGTGKVHGKHCLGEQESKGILAARAWCVNRFEWLTVERTMTDEAKAFSS